MSSNLFKTWGRSFAVRLTLGYAMIFTLSAVVLFGLLYVLLASALERKDREVIEARLKECAAVYANGGLPALRNLVERNSTWERMTRGIQRHADWCRLCAHEIRAAKVKTAGRLKNLPALPDTDVV